MKTLLVNLLLLVSLTVIAQTRDSIYVQFSHDYAGLDRNCVWLIDNFIANYPPTAVVSVSLYGHTDSTGSNQYNMVLSAKRAETVTQYLLAKGFKQQDIKVSAHGYHQPLVAESNDYNKYQNRRVKIVFELNDSLIQAISEASSAWDLEFETINNQNRIDTLYFKGNKISSTLLSYKGYYLVSEETGMALTVPPNCLNTSQLEAVWCLDTYNTVQDVLSTEMYTTTGGIPLESNGFFCITASVNGRPVALVNDSVLTITIPAEQFDPGMQLFTATTNANGFDWDLNTNNALPNMRYDSTLNVYIITTNRTGCYNCDKKLESFELRVKTRKLISKNHELFAASKSRVTAVKMERKRRKYAVDMALLYDEFVVIHRNKKQTLHTMTGNYLHTHVNKQGITIVKLKMKKHHLVAPKEGEEWANVD